MNSKLWIRKALSACLSLSLLATCSLVALANSGKVSGELTVAGNGVNQSNFVLVNGESAQSGRSIFSSSTIATPEGATAVVGFGKLGKIEIASNSNLSLTFDEKGISGNLTSGQVTVLGAVNGVNITTTDGKTVNLAAGESILASGLKDDKDKDDDHHYGGAAWWAFGAVLVAAGAIIIYSAAKSNDRIALGGTGVVVSPTR
ncbi:MAG: hypothetical protein ACR2IH_01850 [Pyrinomonadaceae bacterium]